MVEVNKVTRAEVVQASEMQERLRVRLNESQRRDSATMDSVRPMVLSLVVSEEYQVAKDEIQAYIASKYAFPGLQDRVRRYVDHCVELIAAIQAKREFPGLAALSMTKQQELHEKVLSHFEDLKQTLRHIEGVERDLRLGDVRSTVWVLKGFVYASLSLLVAVAFIDLRDGTLGVAMRVLNSSLDKATLWIAGFLTFL